MASDSPSDVSNKMIKTQPAALGFQVKSGWAAVVLLTETWRAEQKLAALAALFALG
jgi:hypothetical protein